jgi:hypothetical protein
MDYDLEEKQIILGYHDGQIDLRRFENIASVDF